MNILVCKSDMINNYFTFQNFLTFPCKRYIKIFQFLFSEMNQSLNKMVFLLWPALLLLSISGIAVFFNLVNETTSRILTFLNVFLAHFRLGKFKKGSRSDPRRLEIGKNTWCGVLEEVRIYKKKSEILTLVYGESLF